MAYTTCYGEVTPCGATPDPDISFDISSLELPACGKYGAAEMIVLWMLLLFFFFFFFWMVAGFS